jgi:hypothetical protein
LLKNLTAAKGSIKASETIVTPSGSTSDGDGVLTAACGEVEEDVTEMEDMFVSTTVGLEWGGKRGRPKLLCIVFLALIVFLCSDAGPMRGGRFSEPTRFGDWEQKGRCTDF